MDGLAPVSIPFVDTGSYPTRAGNRIHHWIDGERTFQRIGEAIEAARESVWATITFMWPTFQMPDGRGALFDVLDRAARRGVDVRLICWRPDDETASLKPNAFWGSPEHRALLLRYDARINVRWDRAQSGYCQHQKTWLIDASQDDATCFVGSANLNPHSVVRLGCHGPGGYHDVHVELKGQSVMDVRHNFVQRWNEASERAREDGRWGQLATDDLEFSSQLAPSQGDAIVQIQRTIHAGRYTNGHPSSGGRAFPIELGERTILDQYLTAIAAAKHAIYLENQSLTVREVIEALDLALSRGVRVVAVLPAEVASATRPTEPPEIIPGGRSLARLCEYETFTLCGLAERDQDGVRQPVHIHSKVMLIDDEWATVGSCNLHRYSLYGNAELNVTFRDSASVRSLRDALFQEHLGVATAALRAVDALGLFQAIAWENRELRDRQDVEWQGLAFVASMPTSRPPA